MLPAAPGALPVPVLASVGSVLLGFAVAVVVLVGGLAVVARRAARNVPAPKGEIGRAERARSRGHTIPGALAVRGRGRLSLTADHVIFTQAFPRRVVAVARRDITGAESRVEAAGGVGGLLGRRAPVLDIAFDYAGTPAHLVVELALAVSWAVVLNDERIDRPERPDEGARP